jgi:hypothetical protein
VRAVALVLVVAASAAVLPASASSAEAAATVVCWKRLINDWFDGRIDQAYPVRCYREAIKHLPEDVEVYSSAREDIRRALLAAIRSSEQKTGSKPTEATPVKPPPKRATNAPGEGSATRDPDDEGPIDEVLAVGEPNSADSVPVPLIVLAGLALLLLAAAGAGVVTRRLQARKAPAADEPPSLE